jgi:hypothetical protein
MFSLYGLARRPEQAYPRYVEGKLEALDFDLVLQSSLPFQYFYDFVNTHQTYYKTYLEVYMLSKLYQEQLETLIAEERDEDSSRRIDFEELERQRDALLDLIGRYQPTHFNFEYSR